MDPAGPTARRFPLVARPRPACTPLDARVGELSALANTAEHTSDQATASAVLNQAALLASDVGLPELARAWCRRHAEVYLHTVPLDAEAARRALEPLVNLARLRIRAGNGDAASQLLDGLYQAVSSRTDVVLDGLPVPAATLTATSDDHQKVHRWLWTVVLADGVRALTSAGRWHDALTHVRRHKGIGKRMFDGRQVAIIATTTAGDIDSALALLDGTSPGDPWENAVTACLAVLCHQSDRPADPAAAATMLDRYRRLDCTLPPVAFRTRLGLAVLDALGGVEDIGARGIAADLVCRVVKSRDGYAARDLLAHPASASLLTAHDTLDLHRLTNTCGLDSHAIPAALKADLSAALDSSTALLTGTLTARRRCLHEA